MTYLPFFNNVVEQLSSGILDHHDDVRRRCDDLIPAPGRKQRRFSLKSGQKLSSLQLDNVRMPQNLEVLDFPLHSSIHFRLVHLSQIDDLHCHLVTGQRMGSNCQR